MCVERIKMEKEPIRVLHYIKHLESGGGETLLYNIYKHIDREKIQFDFLVNDSKEEKLDKKIEKLGGKKIVLIDKEPKFTPLKIAMVVLRLRKLLETGEYKMFHVHCSNGQGLLFANIAKRVGVPIRLVHAHNTTVEGRFIFLKRLFHNLCRKLFMDAPTDYIACSEMAAKWLYSQEIVENNEYILLKNGIEVEKYRFDQSIREEFRKLIGWDNKKIIINIGRMEEQKNQIFLLNIFKQICRKSEEFRLIIIGKGSLERNIKKHAYSLGLVDKIKFIEYTNEVEKYLFASDLFLLPSLSEGLGIVAIEAQATGLPIVVSDTVPQEAYISSWIMPISLEDSEDVWANEIINMKLVNDRNIGIDYVRKAQYDIRNSAMVLQTLYLNKV